MQPDPLQIVTAWMLGVLVYPGLLFATAMVLAGEWLHSALRPLFTARALRAAPRRDHLLRPLYDFLKLARRQSRPQWLHASERRDMAPLPSTHVVAAIAPLLALSLLPFAGSPIAALGMAGDLFTVLLLLAVQPLLKAFERLRRGDLAALRGARDVGRLLTGLLPALVALAALLEIAPMGSPLLAGLSWPPQDTAEGLVMVLGGAALLLSLHWWLDGKEAQPLGTENAPAHAGRLFQALALSAFWAIMVLPTRGAFAWAALAAIAGTLFAYVALRTLSERWVPARREADAARLAWATAVPLSALALGLALWA